MAALKYLVWLASLTGVDAKTAQRLIDHFGGADKVFFAEEADFQGIQGVNKRNIAGLCKKNIRDAVEIIEYCNDMNWTILTINDAAYPERLRNIYDPPIVLYIRGKLPVVDEEAAVAVVGTRQCTPYGVKMAEKIGYDLTRYGCVLVCGLARGIDIAAAKGALRGGGKIIGVAGCGLDVPYPSDNVRIMDDIAATGCIISEYPPKTEPAGRNFPVRNRILSGISVGVAVVEAPARSGALDTAIKANEQGRDVFVVPGNADAPSSHGSNALLQEFGAVIFGGADIAQTYAPLFPDKVTIHPKESVKLTPKQEKKLVEDCIDKKDDKPKPQEKVDKQENIEYIDLDSLGLSPEEKFICETLGTQTMHIDDIIQKTGLTATDVLSALTLLEISGVVTQDTGKYFSISHK